MSSKPQNQAKAKCRPHRIRATTVRLTPENELFAKETQNKSGFNRSKIINDWGDKCRNGTPESVEVQTCEAVKCPKFGGVTEGGVLCLTKKSNTDRIHSDTIPFKVATACTEKPFNTSIDKKSREAYESEIERLKPYHHKYSKQRDELNSLRPENARLIVGLQNKTIECDGISKALKISMSDNLQLKGENTELKNGLVRETEKVGLLEHDNEYLRNELKDLSSDALVEKVSFQNVQLGTLRTEIEDYKREIEKLEALNTHKNATLNDVVFKVNKMLREFKQFSPQSIDSFALKDYMRSVQKKIEDFEGYINTVST